MLEINIRISALKTLFHKHLSSLYEPQEIDAIFFTYIDDKFNIKKHHYFLTPDFCIVFENTDLEALSEGCPIQYVTGKATFGNIELSVNSSVLIPRPETEELTAMIIEKQKAESRKQKREVKFLDLCTGSGAIAIAFGKNLTNAKIWATDISEKALETAKKNASACNVNITFLHHNILHDKISYLPKNVDIIVSNPPYIPQNERINLHKNVVDYEPETALFVPDENPLLFYNVIAHIAKKILRKGGVLYFETYENFHYELSTLLTELDFQDIECRSDMNGKPRFVCCKKL
jgi:release factor glutamine methyltransferase